MASTFFAGIERLEQHIGKGKLEGKVKVNQHYALEQHEVLTYEHPRGGGPKYLSGPLMARHDLYLEHLARTLLKVDPAKTMAANMENLSLQLDPAAPLDESPNPIRLRRSGNPIVTEDAGTSAARIVYDRPPIDPREPFLAPDDEQRAYEAESGATPTF